MEVAEKIGEAVLQVEELLDSPVAPIVEQPPVGPTYEQIRRLEAAIPLALDTLDVNEQTKSHFCKGLYARQLDIPKGSVVVGKMHGQENFFLLVKGDMTVWTEHGVRRVAAPFMAVTKPGDKRVGYAHEDSITLNIHPNPDDEADLEVLEGRYIIAESAEGEPALLENEL